MKEGEMEQCSQEQGRVKQTALTQGFYVGLGLLSIGLVTYLCRVKFMTIVTAWNFCPPRGGEAKTQSAIQVNEEQAARQITDIHQQLGLGAEKRTYV